MCEILLLHVPYKGTLPGLIELLAGRVEMIATSSMSLVVPHVRTGKLRVLGITSAARARALPEFPTIAEAGLPGYEAVQWSGVLPPTGTTPDRLTSLHKETAV